MIRNVIAFDEASNLWANDLRYFDNIGTLYYKVPRVCMPEIIIVFTFLQWEGEFVLVGLAEIGLKWSDYKDEVADVWVVKCFPPVHSILFLLRRLILYVIYLW